MQIRVISRKIICSSSTGIHNYFAWPTVTRLQNGRLAMVASGFRLTHRCPFGKVVICYSDDEGQSWTSPAVLIDTPLDDRDGGIAAFGAQDVIVTSFTNSIPVQRSWVPDDPDYPAYRTAYLDAVERRGGWEQYLGSTFRISHDCGVSFGPIGRLPVSCPHGPAVFPDGSLLYVGTVFDDVTIPPKQGNQIECWHVFSDGSCEKLSEIQEVGSGLMNVEPHAIVLRSGKILVHIRVQDEKRRTAFTLYQSESTDGGRTFSVPHPILAPKSGAPAHLLEAGDTVLCTYSHRNEPFGIRAAFSKDEGRSWDFDYILTDDGACWDLGYPSTVVLRDGTLLTTYYGRLTPDSPAVIQQIIWKFINE